MCRGARMTIEGVSESFVLVVLGGDTARPATFPLPNAARLSVGRSTQNDIRIDAPSLSRRHAVLTIGDVITIEDLGSANGTRIRVRVSPSTTTSLAPTDKLVLDSETLQPGQSRRVQPGDLIELGSCIMTIQRASATRNTSAEPHASRKTAAEGREIVPIVLDAAHRRVYALVEKITDSSIPVLILGETGVGKEILAETIHKRSRRSNKPMVRLNCAALSESLLEGELFGYERGAFTGAVQSKPGLLEAADGGTLFLDEVGELSLGTQAKLLRVVEANELLRVGAIRPRAINVRFIAATNRDLSQEVQSGRFREDLFHRISGMTFVLPPLRERTCEIVPLSRMFISTCCKKLGFTKEPELCPEAIQWLIACPWPGNIRQLRNVMERAVLLGHPGPIWLEHLPTDATESISHEDASARATMRPPLPDRPSGYPVMPTWQAGRVDDRDAGLDASEPGTLPGTPGQSGPSPGSVEQLREQLAQAERTRVVAALAACAGNQTRAAAMLGLSRQALIARLDAYQLSRPRRKKKRDE